MTPCRKALASLPPCSTMQGPDGVGQRGSPWAIKAPMIGNLVMQPARSFIAERLYERTKDLDADPRSILVFGVIDTIVWLEINCQGRVVVVDEYQNTIDQVRPLAPRASAGSPGIACQRAQLSVAVAVSEGVRCRRVAFLHVAAEARHKEPQRLRGVPGGLQGVAERGGGLF